MHSHLLRLCVAALSVAGFLTLSPRASAETVTLELTGGGNGYNGGGPFYWTEKAGANVGSAVTTYCIDVQKYVPAVNGTATYTVTSLNNAPTIVAASVSATNAKVAAITTLYDHYYNSSFANSIASAAFQLALWDLVYGATNPTLLNSAGADLAGDSQAVKNLAAQMLNNTAPNAANDNLTLVALTSGSNQDQIMVVKNVPAPPAVMLAGIGVLALFGRNRWGRKKTATA